MYATLPDITVSGHDGLALAVQVKNIPSWTAEEAQDYVNGLFDRGASLSTRFLMLLSQETAFIWRVAAPPASGLHPVAAIPVRTVFDRNARLSRLTHRLSDGDLQMLAVGWLSRISDGLTTDDDLPPHLRETGLVDAIRDGTISWPVAQMQRTATPL